MHIFITLFVESCFQAHKEKQAQPSQQLVWKETNAGREASTVRAQVWAIHKLRFREEGIKTYELEKILDLYL